MEPKDNEDIYKDMPSFRERNDDDDEDVEIYFTENQLSNFEECFKKIDKTGSGRILISEIGSILRAVGMNPSLKMVKEITDWYEMNEIDQISFSDFIKLLKKSWKETDAHELRSAIEVFDPTGNGYLTVEHLKSTLMNLGENLDEDDFKEILKTITVQPDGTINIEDIVQLLTTSF